MNPVERLTAAIPSVMRTLLRHAPMSPGKVEAAWRLAVGPAIARATSVALAGDGTLAVSATAPAWRRELKRSQEVILSRLQDLLGADTVRRMKVEGRTGRA